MFRSVQQAQESVDSRSSVAGGRQMSTAELAQMEAAGYGFAQQFATEAVWRTTSWSESLSVS